MLAFPRPLARSFSLSLCLNKIGEEDASLVFFLLLPLLFIILDEVLIVNRGVFLFHFAFFFSYFAPWSKEWCNIHTQAQAQVQAHAYILMKSLHYERKG